jgi:Cys-rich four helix bundle protein (predicted Tat secretion target)
MDRREALTGLGAITLAALADSASAQEHEHHHMHDAPKNQALVDAAADCVQKGQACVTHCNKLLGEGDKDMSACQTTALQAIAVCAAVQQLGNLNSPHLAKVAAAAADICKACEDECRKHEKKHVSCKECGDACAACAKQCKALSA